MSSKRRRRIGALVTSWRNFLPQVIDRLSKSDSNATSNVAHREVKSFLLREAQKRWSVSFSTAREYARSAYLTIARELEEELKKRRSGINKMWGVQVYPVENNLTEISEWLISMDDFYGRSPWQGCLPALLLTTIFPSSIHH